MDYTIEDIYQGGYSSLAPDYGNIFTGYRVAASELGASTKIDTANQLQQVGMLANQGIVPIEVGTLQPDTFDQIPKQHFKEINQLAKLTGVKTSVHAPMIEPSGFTQDGWSEANRMSAEQQLKDIVERSHDMDDQGGMPITVHASGIPGREIGYVEEDGERKRKEQKLIVINQETKKLAPVEEEIKHYPGLLDKEGKPISATEPQTYKPRDELDVLNSSEWSNSVSQAVFYKEGADRILSENAIQVMDILKQDPEKLNSPGFFNTLSPAQRQAYGHVKNAEAYLQNTRQYLNGLFDKAYKYGTDNDRKVLNQASEKFAEEFKKSGGNPVAYSQAMQGLIVELEKVTPQIYVPVEDFALKESSETFANVAFNAYDKFGDKAPTISIENFHPGTAFAYGEDIDNLIQESRKKFVEKAVKEGYSRSQAKKDAENVIGMTLDLGHLNIAKKRGFKDKDILKEVEKISKHVKHVHLADNFGYSDSHLPPGMGDVPNKEVLKELEKKGFSGKKIIEAGAFVQHFGISPFQYVLEGMGAPIFATQTTPYWNQALGLYQGYFGGMGPTLPQRNYETFGAGFSQLPTELGGNIQAPGGSRMSGKQME